MAKFTSKYVGLTAVIAGVFALGAIGGTIGVLAKLSDRETTKVLSASAYTIGLLDDQTGKLPAEDDEKDLSGISTTDFYLLEGLKIEMSTNANVRYQVDYYDAYKQFITVQTWKKDFSEEIIPSAADATYVKIEIIPLDDTDGKVSIFEKSGYAKRLTVTVNTKNSPMETNGVEKVYAPLSVTYGNDYDRSTLDKTNRLSIQPYGIMLPYGGITFKAKSGYELMFYSLDNIDPVSTNGVMTYWCAEERTFLDSFLLGITIRKEDNSEFDLETESIYASDYIEASDPAVLLYATWR